VTSLVAVADNVVTSWGKCSCLAVVLTFCCAHHLTDVTAFRNFALACSTVVSVTNRASFGARAFVIDESSSEKQARRGVQIYKVHNERAFEYTPEVGNHRGTYQQRADLSYTLVEVT